MSQVVIENDFSSTGDVVVTRAQTVGSHASAYTWRVTFVDLYGVVPDLSVTGTLTGLNLFVWLFVQLRGVASQCACDTRLV
jgi:hypothetical protein